MNRAAHPAARAATVAEAMSRDVVTAAPEDTLGETAERLAERDVGSAVVVEYGRLIGILTSRDLVRAIAARSHPSEARVRHWMTADVVTAPPTLPLADAAALMAERGFHHLPVVEAGRPLGVIGFRAALAGSEPDR